MHKHQSKYFLCIAQRRRNETKKVLPKTLKTVRCQQINKLNNISPKITIDITLYILASYNSIIFYF